MNYRIHPHRKGISITISRNNRSFIFLGIVLRHRQYLLLFTPWFQIQDGDLII